MIYISYRGAFFCRMRPLGDICKKLFRLSKNDIISNCSTDSPVFENVSGVPPIDAKFIGEYFIKSDLFLLDASFRRYLKKNGENYFFFEKMTLLQTALPTHP